MVCIKCGRIIDDQDKYCRHCGNPFKNNEELPWFYRRWTIYPVIFIFGPLALPLVFKNPANSQNKKIILAAITIAYTCILLSLSALIMSYIYKQILGFGCY